MKKTIQVFVATALILGVVSPILATAQTIKCPDGSTPPAGQPCKIPDSAINNIGAVIPLLDTITNWLFTFLMIFAVIMFIWAAYLYLFSGGSEESTGKAKGFIIYAVVGIIVAMLAKGITFVVYQILK